MERLLHIAKKVIPTPLFKTLQPIYHYFLAYLGAFIYRFPSREITVVVITGTKGKSSTTEILNAILEAAGKKTAMAGTIRFKVGDKIWPNKYKMTVQGRFFLQRFLRQAVDAKCDYAILEMTSEAATQYRHKFIDFDALLFLNISPEHIESHGGYDKYLAAKLELAKALEHSCKPRRIVIANADDKEHEKFLHVTAEEKYTFSLKDAEPYILDHYGLYMTYKTLNLRSHLQGVFNIYNILAALTYASTQGITPETAQVGLENLKGIAGRVQKINLPESNLLQKKQNFTVVVDYAHTADSLEKIYGVFKDTRKICVLGNTGGGRDTWKRPEMAKVANDNCSQIILTNEDPYDEDPRKIINDMLPGITSTPYKIIMDRREAINYAITLAHTPERAPRYESTTVIISGKGTDPYIMEARGKKTPWSDAKVAEQEIEKVLATKK
ncbi:UDP-N-acetylmuramyl-tripeptide synthetase [Patescibacteria group bacterium]|nr:UDP-N-acetylmuramyl-tripeptide synthetase [Patescibacteria group bacterium]